MGNWRRTAMGILALVFLATGAALTWFSDNDDASGNGFTAATCFRIGALLGVIWLALPDVLQPRNWMWLGGVLLTVLVAARAPQLLPYVIVGLLIFAVLRPRLASKPAVRRR